MGLKDVLLWNQQWTDYDWNAMDEKKYMTHYCQYIQYFIGTIKHE